MHTSSYVVTGGGRGVGRAIVERLAGAHDTVAVIEFDGDSLAWVDEHPAAGRIVPVLGDAADEAVAARAPPTSPRPPRHCAAGSTMPRSSATPGCTRTHPVRSST